MSPARGPDSTAPNPGLDYYGVGRLVLQGFINWKGI